MKSELTGKGCGIRNSGGSLFRPFVFCGMTLVNIIMENKIGNVNWKKTVFHGPKSCISVNSSRLSRLSKIGRNDGEHRARCVPRDVAVVLSRIVVGGNRLYRVTRGLFSSCWVICHLISLSNWHS